MLVYVRSFDLVFPQVLARHTAEILLEWGLAYGSTIAQQSWHGTMADARNEGIHPEEDAPCLGIPSSVDNHSRVL